MTFFAPTIFPPAQDEKDVLVLTRQREASIAAAGAAAIAGTPADELGDHREFADRILNEVGVTDPAERTPLIGVILSTLGEGTINGK